MKTAVYDLRCAPITFDFCNFLAIAYMLSKSGGDNCFDLLIRADSYRNVTPREKSYSIHDREWRLRNLIMEVVQATPYVRNVTILRDSVLQLDHFSGVLQVGYDAIERRGVPYLLVHAKEVYHATKVRPSIFRASDYAKQRIAALIGGEPYVTVTLRQATFDTARNSDLQAWSDAIARFSSLTGIRVLVIPDQDDLLSTQHYLKYDWRVLSFAAFSLDLRIALMAGAKNNFVSAGGLAAPLWYSDIKYVMFNIVHQGHYVADEKYLLNSAGLKSGESFSWSDREQVFEWQSLTPDQILARYL